MEVGLNSMSAALSDYQTLACDPGQWADWLSVAQDCKWHRDGTRLSWILTCKVTWARAGHKQGTVGLKTFLRLRKEYVLLIHSSTEASFDHRCFAGICPARRGRGRLHCRSTLHHSPLPWEADGARIGWRERLTCREARGRGGGAR